MMDFIEANMLILACVFAGLCIAAAAYVLIEFFSYTSAKYKERFIQEAAIELDDVLLQLPPGRVLDLSLALAALALILTVGGLCFFTSNPSIFKLIFFAVIAVLLTFPIPRFYLKMSKKRRLAKFNEQLEDALLAMSSSLKAGFSINQALEVVASERRPPISFEFTLLMQEIRLGVPLDEALENMNKRLGSQDFELVAIAIVTARQTGGELTSILERLAAVIRERVKIMQKIKSLTAQGRMQAWMIGIMPIVLMFAMNYIAPDMMNAFFSSAIGVLLITGAFILDVAGFLMIRKITNIDI